jgi:hypothetical protein
VDWVSISRACVAHLAFDTMAQLQEGDDVAQLQPVDMAPLLRQVPGKWVALRNGEIVEVRDTLDALTVALEERGLSDVTVLRAPAEGETEMVGLG